MHSLPLRSSMVKNVTTAAIAVSISINADYLAAASLVKLRTFSETEVAEWLQSHGYDDEPVKLQRLPQADGIRITLSSNYAVELRCNESVTYRELPGRMTYFDSENNPVAWYEGQRLRFASALQGHEMTNAISIDPSGRYFVTRYGMGGDRTIRVYTTDNVTDSIGTTGLIGNVWVFSTQRQVITVGNSINDEERSLTAIIYDMAERMLIERERIRIPEPNLWFGGRLTPEDAKPDGSEILFVFWRDSPFAHRLYTFDLRSKRLRHISKLPDYRAYVACDPFSVNN